MILAWPFTRSVHFLFLTRWVMRNSHFQVSPALKRSLSLLEHFWLSKWLLALTEDSLCTRIYINMIVFLSTVQMKYNIIFLQDNVARFCVTFTLAVHHQRYWPLVQRVVRRPILVERFGDLQCRYWEHWKQFRWQRETYMAHGFGVRGRRVLQSKTILWFVFENTCSRGSYFDVKLKEKFLLLEITFYTMVGAVLEIPDGCYHYEENTDEVVAVMPTREDCIHRCLVWLLSTLLYHPLVLSILC